VLHDFNLIDGGDPVGGLIRDGSGHLYGATGIGGAFAQGTIFGLDEGGHLTFLHSLNLNEGGFRPFGGLVGDEKRYVYGTAFGGGISSPTCNPGGCGLVFEISPSGEKRVIHKFTDFNTGSGPSGGVIGRHESDGGLDLFGTTLGTQPTLAGSVVFKLNVPKDSD
jgi:uncharacterized repeat protein (TIGR03803 family)